MNGVMGNQIPIAFVTLAAALPQLSSAKMKALAVTSSMRSSAAPGIPTMAESGLPGMELSEWFGILVPAKTSTPLIRRLDAEARKSS